MIVSLATLFQKSSQFVLDLILPPHCLNCHSIGSWLCQSCLAKINLITGQICCWCGLPLPGALSAVCRNCAGQRPLLALKGIRSAAHFENNPIRSAIHFLKYQNHRAVVTILSQLLVEAYHHYNLRVDSVVSVPLHPVRLRERGYNQSDLLAEEVSRALELPFHRTALRRVRWSQPQIGLGVPERYANVSEAFVCATSHLAGQTILLLDDVCTTGATLDACAAALRQNGVAAVWGLTLARATVDVAPPAHH